MKTRYLLQPRRLIVPGLFLSISLLQAAPVERSIHLTPIGRYATSWFGAEVAVTTIAAYDQTTHRVYVVNGYEQTLDALNISDPANPTKVASLDLLPFGGGVNSVTVRSGLVAVAVANAAQKTDDGLVVFFDRDLNFINSVMVGALPDMLTFSPNGRWLLVANEGEPSSYGQANSIDPEGSISIIDLTAQAAHLTQADVRTARFTQWNGQEDALRSAGIRIFGPGATAAQDLEPEYIAVSHDSKTAWVTLQENNAMATVDLDTATVTELVGLGLKDHSALGNGLDASDRDGTINIARWPVFGMFQPDGMAAYQSGGDTYLVLANEGDAREWPGFSREDVRVSSLQLDPVSFPDAKALQKNAALGRLRVSRVSGDLDGDGLFEQLWTFGTRSFSIRGTAGQLIWDSGDQFEQITAQRYPENFNASHDENTFDNRSPSRGPEPEGVALGHLFGRDFAFVGLERIGGVMVYDITAPFSPRFVDYVNLRDFTQEPSMPVDGVTLGNPAAGDLGPEGLIVIQSEQSPTGKPLLVTANEVSGTLTLFEITKEK
jgi:hypothetical protein